jgi:hypothetical protein
MCDASEQAREHLAAARPAQHDQLGIEGLGLRENRLGDAVDGRVAHGPADGEAGHPQLEGRRLGDKGSLIPGLGRDPPVAGQLVYPQMQRPDLGHSLGRDILHQFEHGLALVHVVDRQQDPREHPTSRGLHLALRPQHHPPSSPGVEDGRSTRPA